MSLQVWLPLNGDLTQQGLSGVEATNNGATVNNEGKIGKCYQFGTAASYMTIPAESMKTCTEASVSFWVKILSWNTSYATLFQAGTNGYSWQNYIFGVLRNSTNSTLCFTIGNGSTTSTTICQTSTLELNTWYHLTFTYNSNGDYSIYINGILNKKSHTDSIIPAFSQITMITLGRANGNGYQSNCLMNDVRIYDHCLSVKEVKELSKGLVIHYKLDNNGCGPTNLLLNGFGELGTTNWGNVSGVTTTDLPSANSNIKAKFKDTTSQEYIPIYRNHTYKISLYVKAASTSSSNYPSIKAYDIDKNEIQNYQEPTGFNLNTMTTLTQELKAGDTKIYVANLSNWNANSGHYYNHAAIFDYVDSTGYKYPIGTYTRITPTFGSGTNAKTNLDKTNNIITLNTPYSGKTILVGTSVCASTDGGTYYYPLGGITNSTVQDWTFKETTFSSEANRLKYAKYMRFYAYSNAYYAGITISDQNMINNVEWDCSGNNYHGTINGTTLTSTKNNNIKYSNNTHINQADYISISPSPTSEIKTISLWAKWDSIPSGQSLIFVDYKSKLGLGLVSNGILCGTQGPGNYKIYSRNNLVANVWYHFVVINEGDATSTTRKLYINGIEQTPLTTTNVWNYTIDQLQLGKRSNTSDGFIGNLSDFRAYATALSAEDVAELYHTAASVDNHGNVYAGEIKEV